MDLYKAQRLAQDNGYDSAKFLAMFPSGPKVCSWLDAYCGLFTIAGMGDGFVTVRQIDEMFPTLEVLPLPMSSDDAADETPRASEG